MGRIVGRHEGPLAHTLDQAPALVGLQVVVVTAVAVEAVEGRAVGPGPVLAVVPLAGGGTATLDGTRGIEPLQPPETCTALGRRPRCATPVTFWPVVNTAAKKV